MRESFERFYNQYVEQQLFDSKQILYFELFTYRFIIIILYSL